MILVGGWQIEGSWWLIGLIGSIRGVCICIVMSVRLMQSICEISTRFNGLWIIIEHCWLI